MTIDKSATSANSALKRSQIPASMKIMDTFEDLPFDSDERWGRTRCRECGTEFVELLVPHSRTRPALVCSSRCAWKRSERKSLWEHIQGSASSTESD